jgi:phosphoribosylaminoimidazole carboxylase
MLNLIGASSKMSELTAITNEAIALPGVSVHLYGKADCRKGRKMGHITIVADCDAQLHTRLRPLLLLEATYSQSTEEENSRYSPAPPHFRSGHSHPFPLVGVIMGSDSDLPVMLPAAHILDHFEVPYELTIVSSHRTPDRLVQYAKTASSRGLRVIIAGAGGAAHLPGMVASMTALPVIGVPVKGRSLDGVDSLHSIVQMPVSLTLLFVLLKECQLMYCGSISQRGIPVATVAINNGANAGILSVRILSVGMPRLVDAMEKYLKALEEEVLEKVEKLEEVGWEEYVVKK